MATDIEKVTCNVSARCLDGIKGQSLMTKYFPVAFERGEYDPESNPEGFNMICHAQSKVSEDMISDKISKIDVSKYTTLQYYFDWNIEKLFKNKMADFFTEKFASLKAINPNNLLTFFGTDTAFECLIAAVCDPGDYILVPAPHYSYVISASGLYVQAKVYLANRDNQAGEDSESFELTINTLEQAYKEAADKGYNIRAVHIINPDNPTGNVLSKKTLVDILHFANRHNIHAIFDEILALSTWHPNTVFHSVLSVSDIPNPQMTHFLWGFSKDFCVPGFFCGLMHTENSLIKKFYNQMIFRDCPLMLKVRCMELISDKGWVDSYLKTNNARLYEAFKKCRDKLQDMGGYVPTAKAGLALLVDLSKYLRTQTFEAEEELYSKFIDAGVIINPGQDYSCPQPGWFRIIFCCKAHDIDKAMSRMQSVLKNLDY